MSLKFQNDPAVLAWLDSSPGRRWLAEKHRVPCGSDGVFASLKPQSSPFCFPMNWCWGGEDSRITVADDEGIFYVPQIAPKGHP